MSIGTDELGEAVKEMVEVHGRPSFINTRVSEAAEAVIKCYELQSDHIDNLERGKEELRAECERLSKIDRPEPTTDTADICSAVDELKSYATGVNSVGAGVLVDRVADELGRLVDGHKAKVKWINQELTDQISDSESSMSQMEDNHARKVKGLKGLIGALRRDGTGNGYKRLCDSLASDRRNLRESLDHIQAGYAHTCADNEALRDRIKELEADK